MAGTRNQPDAQGIEQETPSSPPPPQVGHLKPVLNEPGAVISLRENRLQIPSIEVDLLLMDVTTKEMAMDDFDIVLLLTSNTALPLLRAFKEVLDGNDGLREEVDCILIGDGSGADDPLEQYATCAQDFAEKVLQYDKYPLMFQYTYSTHQTAGIAEEGWRRSRLCRGRAQEGIKSSWGVRCSIRLKSTIAREMSVVISAVRVLMVLRLAWSERLRC